MMRKETQGTGAGASAIFGRMVAARRNRVLQALAARMSDHLLLDVGFTRDHWGALHKAPAEGN